jgi:hypothetical protein
MKSIHFFLIGFLLLSFPSAAVAKRDPYRNWQQLATGHFLLIYPADIADQAAQAAVIAEQAYPKVKGLFGYAPPGKTPLVLNPDTDMANGYSTGIYTKMEFYLASPTDKWDGTLNASWLESLMYHEYAHLCHGLRAQGFTKVLTWIFGGVNAVNFISPQWWNEGVAEYSETVLTAGGRGRNPYHAMKLAANLLSDDPWSLGQLGTPPRYSFPSDRHYVGGYDLVARLGKETQRSDFLDRAAAQQSAFPFFGLGFVWRRSLKTGVNAIYEKVWHGKLLEFEKQFGAERPLGEGARDWTQDTEGQFYFPHWTAQGDLVAYVHSLGRGPELVRLPATGGDPEVIAAPPLVTGEVTYELRTQTYYYARLVWDPIFDNTLIAEMFAYNAQGERQLTHQGRCWSPDVAADGRVVCVVNRFGPTQLAILNPATGSLAPIPAVPGALYLSPRWSPDGKQLAAVVRIHGHQDVCLVDITSGALTPLTGWDLAGDHDPAWSRDGQILYFVSDRTRVHQVYAYRLATRELFQVTDSRLGVFNPAVSPDNRQLAVAEYRVGNHQQIVTLLLDPGRWKPAVLPAPQAQPAPSAEVSAPPAPGESYAAWPHLLPTYWIPNFGQDQDGTLIGALSARQEPLELHSWQGQVLVQPMNGKMYGSFEYNNDLTWFTFGAQVFSLPFYRWRTNDQSNSALRDWARSEGIQLSDAWTWNWFKAENRSGLVKLAGQYEAYRLLGGDDAVFTDTTFAGATADLTAGYIRQSARDMFPTGGWLLQGSGRWAWPGHGYDGQLAWAGMDAYCPSLVKHQALKVGLRASTRRGRFPDSFTETLPLGYHDDERTHGAKVSAAYQFPLWYFDNGPDLLPMFFHGFWGEVSGDWGAAFEPMAMDAWKERARYSASLMVHMDFEAFWYLPMRLNAAATVTQDGNVEYTLNLGAGL